MNDQSARARERLDEAFGESNEPVDVVSAPGRVNLIGGHTDYNEGFVLPAGIDRRTVVAARPRDDRTIGVSSTNFDQTVSFDLSPISHSDDAPWSDYVRGVAERLVDRGYDVGGTELAVVGDVPMGAGLSSSAAFEVAVAAALAAVHDLSVDDEELVAVCWEAETEFVGLSCGIMDQYAAVHAERESALFLDCRDESHETVPLPSDEVTVVATNTNVQRELVDSAYNDRVATCREGVEFFDDALDEPIESLRDVSVETFEARESELPETVRKRVRHVVTENERVRDAAAALREGRLDRVGTLLDESHASLRDDYEVSVDELDAVASIAGDLDGVFGSRMTGAGFGGCVVTLVRPDAAEAVTSAIDERYRDRTGIEPDVYVCNPDGGVRRHE
ncbi:galactokinase [Halosimplex aquaticum]|uniref:Galactokinase n=1 Tax=Halosimplex aquaticum TaxID=3026162 RepID=A0ABD5Y4K0_9EURY|nr:galactokinase [Halosimplex aquaticum]